MRPTKLLRPRPAADAISRPRLLRALDGGRACPLVLVSGPAGYGKTTVLGQWLATSARPAGWVTLDDRDDALGVVTHLVAALQAILPGIGRAVLSLLGLPGRVTPADVGAALAEELAALDDEAPDVIVVLDDLHEVADPGAHELLDALLRYPPPRLQLVIATRVDPPLPLARLRVRGQLLELRAADLRFSPEEAVAFLHGSAPGAPPGAAAALAAGTEGWAAGIRLAAVALPRGATAAEVGGAFTGHRQAPALEYLLEEVLARQSPWFQDALLRSAVPERLCASLCDALLVPGGPAAAPAPPAGDPPAGDPPAGDPPAGDCAPPGAEFLATVARANLFLTPLDALVRPAPGPAGGGAAVAAEVWYRYHPLFRELLLRQGRARLSPAGVASLHARAGAWFGAAGMVEEALAHLLVAGDVGGAAALVEGRVGPAYVTDEWPALERWLDLLPPDVVRRRPAALLARAWVVKRSGRHGAIPELVAAVRALLDAPPDGAGPGSPGSVSGRERAALEAECDALTAAARFSAGDIAGALAGADLALARPEAAPRTRALAIVYAVAGTLATKGVDAAAGRLGALTAAVTAPPGGLDLSGALMSLGSAQVWAARLHEAEQTGRALLARGEGGGPPQARWWGHLLVGAVRYEWNDPHTAADHFRAILEERDGIPLLVWRGAVFGLALTLQAQGHPDASGRALDGLADALVKTGNTRQLAMLASFRAHLAWRRGDPAAARRWLREAGDTRSHWLHTLTGLAPQTRERAASIGPAALAGHEAPDDLDVLLAETERLHADKRRVEVLVVQALERDARGQPDAALDALGQAVDLAQPGGLVRTFLDLGPPVVVLLQRLAARRTPVSDYLTRLLAAGLAGEAGGAVANPGAPALPVPEQPGGAVADAAEDPGPAPEPLTGREREVLARLAQRRSNKEIAAELHVTPETVKTHAAHVYAKLGVSGRLAAVRRAAELRLVAGD